MTWNEPETATIFLVNGEQVSANVNGISLEDGSGHAFVRGREIKVLPLRGAWADTWGEAITLQHRENAITLALNPTEISDRWAIVDPNGGKKTLYLLYDTGGIWREMTGEELTQWRRIWMDGKHDRERIEREWHIYLHTKTLMTWHDSSTQPMNSLPRSTHIPHAKQARSHGSKCQRTTGSS